MKQDEYANDIGILVLKENSQINTNTIFHQDCNNSYMHAKTLTVVYEYGT